MLDAGTGAGGGQTELLGEVLLAHAFELGPDQGAAVDGCRDSIKTLESLLTT